MRVEDALTFAFAASVRDWPRRWARSVADHGPGRVVDFVAERQGLYDRDYALLVVDADSGLIDAGVVDELHRRGRGVVAVWDPTDASTKELALRMGADSLVEADASADEFARVVLDLGAEWGEFTALADAPTPSATEDPFRSSTGATRSPMRTGAGGRRVVVAGPAGAESVEVAVELARTVGERGEVCVLVDANDVDSSVAQRLDLPLLPNLAMAVDAVRDPRVGLSETLASVSAGRFWALAGLADPAQWAELNPTEVGEVIEMLACGSHHVVVQAGPLAEDLAARGGADRFGLTRVLLGTAEVIVGVGVASPTGITRLGHWLADVRLIAPATTVHVVAARGPTDRLRRAEVADRLHAYGAQLASVVVVAPDPRVEAAAWDGTLVRRGPFRDAIAPLARLVVPPAPRPSRRRAAGVSRG